MLKIIHDFNDPRRIDNEGRIILHSPDDLKSERVELVEGMHVLIDGDNFVHEAILELVEQVTSDGPVDEWRARILPGTFRYTDEEVPEPEWIVEVIRKNDVYAAKCIRPEEKGKWDMTKERLRNRWDLYIFLRSQWNLPCDEIEKLFKEADLAWYQEHKRRRELGSQVQQVNKDKDLK
jgi:hypothetical protein